MRWTENHSSKPASGSPLNVPVPGNNQDSIITASHPRPWVLGASLGSVALGTSENSHCTNQFTEIDSPVTFCVCTGPCSCVCRRVFIRVCVHAETRSQCQMSFLRGYVLSMRTCLLLGPGLPDSDRLAQRFSCPLSPPARFLRWIVETQLSSF